MCLLPEDEGGLFWLQLGLKPLGENSKAQVSNGVGIQRTLGVLVEFYFLSYHLANNYHMPDVKFYILWDMQIYSQKKWS